MIVRFSRPTETISSVPTLLQPRSPRSLNGTRMRSVVVPFVRADLVRELGVEDGRGVAPSSKSSAASRSSIAGPTTSSSK